MSDTSEDELKDDPAKKYLYLISAAQLAACILFVAALLAIQKLDIPLTVAVIAFAITLPFLTLVALEYPLNLLRNATLSLWIIFYIGSFAFLVGIAAIFWHIDELLAFPVLIVSSLIVALIWISWTRTAEKQEQLGEIRPVPNKRRSKIR